MVTFQLIEADTIRFQVSELPQNYIPAVKELGFVADGDRFFREFFPPVDMTIDRIFHHFTTTFELMVHQQVYQLEIPWLSSLRKFLELVKDHNLSWWITGSAALAVRGLPITPRDIDLVTDRNTALALGTLLELCLIEPVTKTDWLGSFFGRAFDGIRIEWLGEIDNTDPYARQNFGNEIEPEIVEWQGYRLNVAPLPLLLEQNRQRNLTDRVCLIEQSGLL